MQVDNLPGTVMAGNEFGGGGGCFTLPAAVLDSLTQFRA
jgi:hypothetical protein